MLQERTKAMGYVESNLLKADHTAVVPLDDVARLRAPDNVNQLLVHVIGCSGIESRRKGSVSVDPVLKSKRIILFFHNQQNCITILLISVAFLVQDAFHYEFALLDEAASVAYMYASLKYHI